MSRWLCDADVLISLMTGARGSLEEK